MQSMLLRTIVIIAACASVTRADPPSNLALIAAMSPQAESVWVMRDADLGAEGSFLSELHDGTIRELGSTRAAKHENDLQPVVERAIAQAKPVVHAHGGSGFTWPGGIGVGPFTQRSIWAVEEPLEALRTRLEAGEGITGPLESFEFQGVKVYHATSYRPERPATPGPVFVALADERTVVIAPDRPQIEHMLRSLAAPGPAVPERWAAAAQGIDLASPVVVLRQYEPGNDRDFYSPVSNPNLGQVRAKIDSLAVALPSVKEKVLRVHGVAEEAQKALDFFKQFGSERILWDVQQDEKGFSGAVRFKLPEQEEAASIYLLLLVFYGPNVVI